jgi:hypothetical protein
MSGMTNLLALRIIDLKLSPDRMSLSWTYGSLAIVKSYSFPIQVANVLRDGRGVAMTESMRESAPRNAVVWNSDGTERFRVSPPFPESQVQGFSDFYYVRDELTAFLVLPGVDYAVVVDEMNGECIRYYETR